MDVNGYLTFYTFNFHTIEKVRERESIELHRRKVILVDFTRISDMEYCGKFDLRYEGLTT